MSLRPPGRHRERLAWRQCKTPRRAHASLLRTRFALPRRCRDPCADNPRARLPAIARRADRIDRSRVDKLAVASGYRVHDAAARAAARGDRGHGSRRVGHSRRTDRVSPAHRRCGGEYRISHPEPQVGRVLGARARAEVRSRTRCELVHRGNPRRGHRHKRRRRVLGTKHGHLRGGLRPFAHPHGGATRTAGPARSGTCESRVHGATLSRRRIGRDGDVAASGSWDPRRTGADGRRLQGDGAPRRKRRVARDCRHARRRACAGGCPAGSQGFGVAALPPFIASRSFAANTLRHARHQIATRPISHTRDSTASATASSAAR